jgi:hypothetical protein
MEIVLALALGGVLGFAVGAARVTSQVRRGRLVRTAGAALAPLLPEAGPTRSLADIWSNRIRVRLGGITYELPVLSIRDNRRWLETLEGQLAAVAGAIEASSSDPESILRLLLGEHEACYELLLSYDQSGVLPPADEVTGLATASEILRGVLLVWQAANPKAVAGLAAGSSTTPGPSSGLPPSTAGATPMSSVN